VRSFAIDSSTVAGRGSFASFAHRLTAGKWVVLVMLLAAPTGLPAQTAGAKPGAKTTAPAVSTVPLGRFVPKDNLILYVEFAGTYSHDESWKKTAAYRMLNETLLGAMLETMGGQLLDKVLEFVPNHTLSGAEAVKLIKHAGTYGCAVAINANPKGGGSAPLQGSLVLREGAGKEIRQITTRLLGRLMADISPKIEEKGERKVIVVAGASPGSGTTPDGGWAWWPEKTDLVVVFPATAGADAVIAAIDGKSPSAVDHPVVQGLLKREGSFDQVCVAFADPVNCPDAPGWFSSTLRKLHADWGVSRLDYQWGFDGDALLAVTRLAAPRPRKSPLSIFDQRTFDKTSLLPRPDGVESFIELSMNPSQLLQAILQLGPPDEFKAEFAEFAEAVKTAGDLDVNKDLLALLGPRIIAYVGTGKPATANDDSAESPLKNGWSAIAAFSLLETAFPKLTLVAEVKKPEAFGKALDAAMIAINSELKAQAIEKAREKQAAGNQPGGQGQGGRMAPAGGTSRKRSLNQTRGPSFTLTPSTNQVKTFVLTTPTDSPIRFGPSSFRPTVQLDDKYVAFAASPDAARAALAAARRKDWKPSGALEKACALAPANLVLFGVTDAAESLPSLLASLPGTLQKTINTSLAIGKAAAPSGANQAAADAPRPAAGGAGAGAGGPPGRRGGMGRAGGPGAAPSPATPPGATSPSGGGTGSDRTTVVLQVDADKMPKSTDLKPLVIPSAYSIDVTDKDIRFVSRAAFPDLNVPIGLMPLVFAIPTVRDALDKLKPAPGQEAQASAPAAQPAAATPAPAGGAPPATKTRGPGGRRGRPGG
jgi:hypothetical protein